MGPRIVQRKGIWSAGGISAGWDAGPRSRIVDHMRRVATLAVLLALAGCAGGLDTEQLRLCRLTVPALHPGDSEIAEVRSLPATLGRRGVRIDYTAREPGE